jgi:ferritin-like protein
MGSAENSLLRETEIQEIIDALDSFHTQSWVVVHLSLALKDRLERQASSLSKELEVKAQESMKHAKKLAERISELGEIDTCNSTEFPMLSPLNRFYMPSSGSNVNVILSHILELEQSTIRTYDDFLYGIKDKDYITYHVLREILEDKVRRESEMESILAVDQT